MRYVENVIYSWMHEPIVPLFAVVLMVFAVLFPTIRVYQWACGRIRTRNLNRSRNVWPVP